MDDFLLDLDPSLNFDFGIVLEAQQQAVEHHSELSSEGTSAVDDSHSAAADEPTKKRTKKREAAKPAAAEAEEEGGVMENSNIRYTPATRKGNAFAFTRDEVARMTPADLDAYEEQVVAHHRLTSDEEALLKKYRRQVRNRASAQNSRARKRQHAEQLQGEVADLKARNAEMDERLGAADCEVRRLRERVHYLEGVLDSRAIPYSKTRVTLGVMAFALVFSCGLFFPLQAAAPASLTPGRFAAAPGFGAVPSQTRQLLDQAPVVAQPAVIESEASPSTVTAGGPSRMRIVEHEELALVPAENVLGSPFVRQHAKSVFPQWDRPNTDYLFCPAAHHVLSTKKDHPDEPSRISLLLPTDVFNGTMEAFRASGAPMVEVTCSVLDIFPVFLSGSEQHHLIDAASAQGQ
jgi:hypothetical protein